MPIEYLPILALIVLAVLFALGTLLMSSIFGPKRPTPEKLSPYECGITPVGTARERFSVKFYLIAMLFIVFDIEIVFLYPWAVVFRQLRLFGLIEMAIFILILCIGLCYAWKKGGLEWE
ncbi:MAG: NADH-quinone oxidoreductase subunit A [candidate division NC10 bacterium]|nr:NADH-quinone oxidoreductase subunit A [candidate division NC10 bacterium]